VVLHMPRGLHVYVAQAASMLMQRAPRQRGQPEGLRFSAIIIPFAGIHILPLHPYIYIAVGKLDVTKDVCCDPSAFGPLATQFIGIQLWMSIKGALKHSEVLLAFVSSHFSTCLLDSFTVLFSSLSIAHVRVLESTSSQR